MERDFKGIWIPAHIWNDTRLGAIAKVVLAEVDSFTARDQSFYKSNETIAIELHCSESTIKRNIATLIKLGYVERVAFDGRRRALRSTIDPAARSSGTGSQLKWSRQTGQNEPADRPKRTASNTEKKTKKKPVKEAVVLPWGSFGETWAAWKAYKQAEHNFRFKTTTSEQAALKQLQNISNNDEQTATAIIHQSIANGWKGLFPIKHQGAKGRTPTDNDRDVFAHYLKTGAVGPDD